MEEKIEQSLSNINSRITNLDEKQDSLVAYVLGLGRHHILGLLDSRLRHIESGVSYVVAIVGLGIALFALGEAYQGFAGWGLMIIGVGLIVYAIVENRRLRAHIRTIEKLVKEAQDIMSDTQQLKTYLIHEAEK